MFLINAWVSALVIRVSDTSLLRIFSNLLLCQRLDLGLCATGSASDPLLLSGTKSTGRASGTLLFSREKTLDWFTLIQKSKPC